MMYPNNPLEITPIALIVLMTLEIILIAIITQYTQVDIKHGIPVCDVTPSGQVMIESDNGPVLFEDPIWDQHTEGSHLTVIATGSLSTLPIQVGPEIKRKTSRYPFGAFWKVVDDYIPGEGLLFNQYNGSRYMMGVMPTGPKRSSTFFWSIPISEAETYRNMSAEEFREHVSEKTPEADIELLERLPSPSEMALASYADTRMNQWHVPATDNKDCAVIIGKSSNKTKQNE